MKVKQVIESLTRSIESGEYREDDELFITWWSYEDVTLVNEEVKNDQAREVWAKVFDTIDGWEDVDNQQVQQEILSVLEEDEEDTVANTVEVLREVLEEGEGN